MGVASLTPCYGRMHVICHLHRCRIVQNLLEMFSAFSEMPTLCVLKTHSYVNHTIVMSQRAQVPHNTYPSLVAIHFGACFCLLLLEAKNRGVSMLRTIVVFVLFNMQCHTIGQNNNNDDIKDLDKLHTVVPWILACFWGNGYCSSVAFTELLPQ